MRAVKHLPLLFCLLGGLLICADARAQEEDSDASIEELKKGQEQLQNELKETRKELKAIRDLLNKQLRQISRDLASIKAGTRPQPRKGRPADTTVYDVKIDNSPFLGSKDAPVTIVEFADFQCPFCAREYPKLQQMLKDYPNDVKVVFKHFPLGFHKKAPAAHAATVLAQQQLGNEGFWKMHDLIMANFKALDKPDLRKHAEAIGLDLAAFDKLMDDNTSIQALLKDDLAEARRCKVSSTPTVMINGLKMPKRNLPDYKERIDQILKGKGKASN